jgi:hypothetical protein
MSSCLQFLKYLYNYSYLKRCYEVAVYTVNCIWNCILYVTKPAVNHNESME